MHHFAYIEGVLHAEGVDLSELADEIGTPFYCYSSATLERHYRIFDEAFAGIDHAVFYSIKANANQAVVKTLTDLGAGIDVVSEGELRRALALGIPGNRIVFSGVGKTAGEMATALKQSIAGFNVESEQELELLNSLALRLGTRAPVSMRVNPDVDAETHEKISTGKASDKFGIPHSAASALYARAAAMPGIDIRGIDVHIGSQITRLEPFAQAYERIAELLLALRRQGHAIGHVDLGGGLGIPYRGVNDIPPHPEEYAGLVKRIFGHLGVKVILEPGRMIVGNAGILLSRVIYVKDSGSKTFVVIDAAMNDLVRPMLYDAWHDIWPVSEPDPDRPLLTVDVVGPVCESGDIM